jgi:hypothetical protein
MNAPFKPPGEADPTLTSSSAPPPYPQSSAEERLWRQQVSALIVTTSLVSPCLVIASGWLIHGAIGAAVAALPAAAIGAGLVLNDLAIMREVMAGGGTRATLFLRAMIPIGVNTLAALPIYLALFSADIDKLDADRARMVIAPITKAVAATVDQAINKLQTAASTAEIERQRLRSEHDKILAASAIEETALHHRLDEAEERERQFTFELKCEADGSVCLSTSSGAAGDKGPKSKLAGHRRDDAVARATAAQHELEVLRDRRADLLAPVNQRLSKLEDSATIDGSVAALQSRLDKAQGDRDLVIAQRVATDPDIVAARTPWGPGQRLISLVTILLANPVLFAAVLAGKIVQTAFEISGVLRAVRYARLSRAGHEWSAAHQAHYHLTRLTRIEQSTELSKAKIEAKHARWWANREFSDRRLLDLLDGVRSLVLKRFFRRS